MSKRCGAAVILRRMGDRGLISFADQPAPVEDDDILPDDPRAA